MADHAIPRPEYPRPQLVRREWLNLNGTWQFEKDNAKSGRDRGLPASDRLSGEIVVPFCPESRLSGLGDRDFHNAVWYRRAFDLPQGWLDGAVLLHFGAVDYETEVWVNGRAVGRHTGGYSSFSFDITAQLRPGSNVVTVCAEDDTRGGFQPRGKQSDRFESYSCNYTRTTGIWQTVWLERAPKLHIASLKITPDVPNGAVHIEAALSGHAAAGELAAAVNYEGRPMGWGAVRLSGRSARLTVALAEAHLWEPGAPRLYDVALTLDGAGERDEVGSYFGLRSVGWEGGALLLNGRPLFQRLVLDQGFYPEGIYTAPTDADLKRDIEISLGLGFNGARLHQKMFEERFLYWADRLGYLVWGEHASWGLDVQRPSGLEHFLPEWMETLQRDYSHPSLVGWCPFNETFPAQDDAVLANVYRVTKQFDDTRPVIDTSGYVHVVTDVYDVHDYEQDVAVFSARYRALAEGGEVFQNFPGREKYEGQPYFVSEYGGIWWNPGQTDDKAWGYGQSPTSEREFLARYEGLTAALLDNPKVCAFCYTQLYDIEQEVNGLYTYDRRPKFNPEVIRRINVRRAAIEK